MADGDLITRNNQFEYNGLLIGAGTKFHPADMDGLLNAPPIIGRDMDRQDADGNFPGRDNYGARYITFDVVVDSDPDNVFADIKAVNNAFIVRTDPTDVKPFVFQLDDTDGKKFCWMRPRNCAFKLAYETHLGEGHGSVQLVGHDPRYYSLTEHTPSIAVPIGATQATLTINNAGNYTGGPIIEITGPANNPRISNAMDNNRQVRLNINVPAGQILRVDLRQRLVTLEGAVVPAGTIRDDNEWWTMVPGDNDITLNRDDSAAAGLLAVRYRDVWISE